MSPESSPRKVTTLSARFDEDQAAVLERAARLKHWSLAQLIQIGAWEKAVSILNASGAASFPVRKLVDEVLGRVYDPPVEVLGLDGLPLRAEEVQPLDLSVPRPRDAMIDELARAMKSLGPELADIVTELNRARKATTSAQLEAALIDPSLAPADVAARLASEATTTGAQDKVPPDRALQGELDRSSPERIDAARETATNQQGKRRAPKSKSRRN